MSKNNNNIIDMPYAKWMEQVLHDILDMKTDSIAVAAITKSGEYYASYYNVKMADKLVISGIIQQDAMLDTLAANGVIEYEDEDDECDEDGI